MSRQPEHGQPFLAGHAFEDPLAEDPLLQFHREEYHSDSVGAGGGKRNTELGAFARKEVVRDLYQKAGAIARLGVASARASVGEVDEDLDAARDDIVRLTALNVRDEADAAGIVLVLWIVQTLLGGQAAANRGIGHGIPKISNGSSITQLDLAMWPYQIFLW